MDIKPSNVLLSGDGQPMILDFHLARGPLRPGEPAPAWLGGTPDYMAPEHLEAMAAVREGRPIPRAVDGRADVYSLGRVLAEALGDPGPAGSSAGLRHSGNPRVSPGLTAILGKCLRSDPRERYRDPSSLATDLRRHMNDLPLLGVPCRSLAERWRKWRRRRPHALSRGLLWLALLLATVAVAAPIGLFYRQRANEIEAALGDGREHREHHRYSEAARALRRGLDLTGTPWPALAGRRRVLEQELHLVLRDWRAFDLHRLTDRIRFRYGVSPKADAESRALVRRGRAIWKARDLLLEAIGGRREPEVERQIRVDLLDFAVVWADLRVRLAGTDEADEAKREALRVLDEAADRLGPSPALDRDRRHYARALGLARAPLCRSTRPKTPWEYYDLGKSYLRSGKLQRAAEQFRLALESRPQDFWPNFYQGLCAYRLGRFDDAVRAFSICQALAPETAECSYNLALAHEALGQDDQALREYRRALQLDRGLLEAALNQGVLLSRSGRHAEAAASLEETLATAGLSDREALGAMHYNLALIQLAMDRRSNALEHLQAAVDAGHHEARAIRDRLTLRAR